MNYLVCCLLLAPGDCGTEAKAVFVAKCARCHGTDVAKPKGKLGYITDMARLAGNSKLVVPGNPGDSKLWRLVRDGEMPPEDSEDGPLNEAQKDVIKGWIDAGALPSVQKPEEKDAPLALAGTRSSVPFVPRTLQWLGKFHLLLLHFPIVLIFVAAGVEVWWLLARFPVASVLRFRPSVLGDVCVLAGAVAAVPTAILGWLHAVSGHGSSETQMLFAHRWLGTGAAVWLLLVAALIVRAQRRQQGLRTWPVRLLILGGAGLVGVAAHFGGLMVHGANFLDW